jgi:hypothetical protein
MRFAVACVREVAAAALLFVGACALACLFLDPSEPKPSGPGDPEPFPLD